ncbi:hypothetical protein AB0P05_22955 [Streptomyces flaveolus]|uniref:hypothetical protein n=1 Tax=Streptomyces flaveolus TaxID=67297 RepID=UPI003438C61F
MIESGRYHRLLEGRFRARPRADLSEVFAAAERGDVVAEHALVQAPTRYAWRSPGPSRERSS